LKVLSDPLHAGACGGGYGFLASIYTLDKSFWEGGIVPSWTAYVAFITLLHSLLLGGIYHDCGVAKNGLKYKVNEFLLVQRRIIATDKKSK
jgi:hypothetical protein